MTKNLLNSSSLMIIRVAFTIRRMKRMGDKTETTQKGSQPGPVIVKNLMFLQGRNTEELSFTRRSYVYIYNNYVNMDS